MTPGTGQTLLTQEFIMPIAVVVIFVLGWLCGGQR